MSDKVSIATQNLACIAPKYESLLQAATTEHAHPSGLLIENIRLIHYFYTCYYYIIFTKQVLHSAVMQFGRPINVSWLEKYR